MNKALKHKKIAWVLHLGVTEDSQDNPQRFLDEAIARYEDRYDVAPNTAWYTSSPGLKTVDWRGLETELLPMSGPYQRLYLAYIPEEVKRGLED